MQISIAQWFIQSVLFICLFGALEPAFAQQSCIEIFSYSKDQRAINTLDDLGAAMTRGMVLAPEQRDLFDLYRVLFFGDPKYFLGGNTFTTANSILAKHPDIDKPFFREYIIQQHAQSHSSTIALNKFISNQIRHAGQVRSNLFQIESNLGFWKGLFGQRNLTDRQFKSHFDLEVPPSLRRQLVESEIGYTHKISLLFQALKDARLKRIVLYEDPKPLSQAMVDLVHGTGFLNPENIFLLKSLNGLEKIEGFEHILIERDEMSRTLGFQSFANLMTELHVTQPSGTNHQQDLHQVLSQYRKEVMAMPYQAAPPGTQLRVRTLSLQESPFRSCLGLDCSTREYFEKALDPNYIYFTLTDVNSTSNSQVTIVLGTARPTGASMDIPIAFVDKIQHVPIQQIDSVLEAIRRTVLEYGYQLAIPEETIPESGLSNDANVLHHYYFHLRPRSSQLLVSFTPHSNHYRFREVYSRAGGQPNVLLVEANNLREENVTLTPGRETEPWPAPKDLTAKALIEELLALKDSPNEINKIKFVDPKLVLRQLTGNGVSQQVYPQTLHNYIADLALSFTLRKRAFFSLLESSEQPEILLYSAYESGRFKTREWIQIVSELGQWSATTNSTRNFAHKKFTTALENSAGTIPEVFYSLVNWNHVMAKAPSLSALKLATERDANPTSKTPNNLGFTALHSAIQHNDLDSVLYLLSLENIDVNGTSGAKDNGMTPLGLALHQEPIRPEIVDALMAHRDLDVNAVYSNLSQRGTALMDMLFSHNEEGLEILLHHPQIDLRAEVDGVTVLDVTDQIFWPAATEKLKKLLQL